MAKRVTGTRKTRAKGKAKPELLTRRQLALAVGVHMQTVTKWEREGLPIAERGSKGRASHYREVEVRAWLQLREAASKQSGAINPIEERALRERAQAALANQAYQIRMRDLLPRDEVEKVWAAEVAAVRTKLLAWSTTLADQVGRVFTLEGLPGVERVLDEAVRDVLTELAGREDSTAVA